jgi:predicted MFS family arabinose efflux permease
MTNLTTNNGSESKGPAFQWWMISNLGVGAGFSAFVALLIPPYITQLSGSAAEAGVVMAIMSLAAVSGPVLGGFADRYRAHRLILSLGMFGMAFGFAAFAFAADAVTFAPIDAIIIGLSVAAVGAIGPAFIVGANLSQGLQAKRLTTYNLVAPVGQVIGGAIMGAAAGAGMSYSNRFWIAAGVMLLAGLVTWLGSGKAAAKIQVADASPENEDASTGKPKSTGLRSVLISSFGLFLLILTLSSVANNGINNQISNILPNVYGMSEVAVSSLISLAGVLNIVFFFVAGWWMSRSGGMPVLSTGLTLRLVGALLMALLGMISGSPLLLVAAAMQLLYQGSPFTRLTQPAVAVRFATIPAGQANGWVLGASAIGSFVGSVLGGWLADKVGFNAINWMGAIAAGASVLLLIIGLWPAERKKRQAESAAETAAPT